MSNMFDGCKYLINLDLKSFVPKKVEDFKFMFAACSNLKYTNFQSLTTLIYEYSFYKQMS